MYTLANSMVKIDEIVWFWAFFRNSGNFTSIAWKLIKKTNVWYVNPKKKWGKFGCPVFFSESYTKRWSFWSIFKLCEKCSFWGTHWLPGFFFRILYQTLVFLINFYCKIVIFDQKTNVWYENVKKTCIFHIWHTFCAKHRILMTSLKIDQKDQRLV